MANIIFRRALSLVLVFSLLVAGIVIGLCLNVVSYAAEDMGSLTNKGQSLTKTSTDGSNFTFTSKTGNLYTVQLYGPAGAGPNAGKGGYVQAVVSLKAGDKLNIYLGSQADAPSGSRTGAKGTDGNGYGDSGIHKATISLYNMELITAGGGGAQGNLGIGDGTSVDITQIDQPASLRPNSFVGNYLYSSHVESGTATKQNCSICGQYYQGNLQTNIDHKTYYFYTTGGVGGSGSNGGNTTVMAGAPGAAGATSPSGYIRKSVYLGTVSLGPCTQHASWANCRQGVTTTYYCCSSWTQGGTGGTGGSGGASYVDTGNVVSSSMEAGKNDGVSKVVITMGDKVVAPDGESLERMAAATEAIAISLKGSSEMPVMSVISGKEFNFYTTGPTITTGGTADGVTVINNDQSDRYIQVRGKITTNSNTFETVIDGYKYVFNVIQEPDSSNVNVVFN